MGWPALDVRCIGETFGAVFVVEVAPCTDRSGRKTTGFLIEYACCGARATVSRTRMSAIIKRQPKCCDACRRQRLAEANLARGEALSEKLAADMALVELRRRMAASRQDADAARALNAARVAAALAVRRAAMARPYRPQISEAQIRAALARASAPLAKTSQ